MDGQQVTKGQQVTVGPLGHPSLSADDPNAQSALGQLTSSSDNTAAFQGQRQPRTHQHQPSGEVSSDSCVLSVKNCPLFSSRDAATKSTNGSGENDELYKQDIDTMEETKDSDAQSEGKVTMIPVKSSALHGNSKCCGDSILKKSDLNIAALDSQDPAVVLGFEDSLMITPTFRSLRDTGADLPVSHFQPAFLDMDSGASSFTLDLNSADSLSDNKQTVDSFNCKNGSKHLDRNVNSVAAVSKNDTENIYSVAKPAYGRQLLRLEDISSGEDSDPPTNSQPKASASEEACHDQFLDYTELDAIPFSQFELTEDFLSKCSQNATEGSQSRRGKKGIWSLVQRRSPRLSSFEFDSCGSSGSERRQTRHPRSHQTAVYRMARKQKKSKKAMFLSSLFQYLIDEAKRDTSFVEFQLPVDIRDSASYSGEGTVAGGQTAGVSQCCRAEECTTYSPDLDIIPETEVILDSDDHFDANSEDTEDGQHTKEISLSSSDVKYSVGKVGISVGKAS
ncbi:hypothetical protein ACOMHN_041696 [Nucella lapillus]